jgi:hypothetical protein
VPEVPVPPPDPALPDVAVGAAAVVTVEEPAEPAPLSPWPAEDPPMWITGTEAAEYSVLPVDCSASTATTTMIAMTPTPAAGAAKRRSPVFKLLTNPFENSPAGNLSRGPWSHICE